MTVASSRAEAASLIGTFVTAGGLPCNEVAVRNAFPHMAQKIGGSEYVATLRNLGATLQRARVKLKDLTESDLPSLFLTEKFPAMLVVAVEEDRWCVLVAGEDQPRWIAAGSLAGTALRIDTTEQTAERDATGSIASVTSGFRRNVSGLLIASLFTNLVALASPLLVMVIYDRIIPTKSIDTIVAFAIAAGVVFVLDIALRAVRVLTVAHMGSLTERELGVSLFRKLTHLPLSNLEKSGVQDQIARLRQFESFRDVFSGPLFSTFLDLPFVFIFLAVLFYLAPSVALLILGLVAVFIVAAFVSLRVQNSVESEASKTRTAQQKMLHEASKNVSSIQRLGAVEFWTERLEQASKAAAHAARRAKRAKLVAETFGQTLMMAAGAGVIAFGAASAVSGDLSVGALIALITLVWRILGPVQALYSNVSRIKGFVSGLHQIKRVLSLESEHVRAESSGHFKKFFSQIDISNLTHRFDPTQEPVLAGVSLSIKPGEIIVLCGLSGSGRSTLFSLLNRLYTPTSGAIYFDGVDYRQIAVGDLRRGVTMQQHSTEFFHGTIKQNFELSNPVATTEDIWVILRALGMESYINALPDGLETRMDEAFQSKMSKSLGKGLGLARCLLRDSSIYLFDDPCSGLDETHEHQFLTCLKALRGERTVLMISDRPSHWELADTLVFLDRGKVLVNEPRATALPKIKALYSRSEVTK